LLILTETGVPVPVPGDLLMLLVGERASAGEPPLLVAVGLLELITLLGTTVLYLAVRGPARSLIARVGPRVGLTEERIATVGRVTQRGSALAVGRMTPGARTITVVAAATGPSPWHSTLPALWIGSTIFVQAHLALGFVLGPVARDALEAARIPVLVGLGMLILIAVAFWILRSGRGPHAAFSEAFCPVCLTAAAIATKDER
ncbi:MAG: DedA family protein, partial [Actinomycetota bacterium]